MYDAAKVISLWYHIHGS